MGLPDKDVIESMKTFPFFYESNCDKNLYAPACATWHTQYEKQLRERAIKLLQMRAGGRLSSFESGMLYHICLSLGMEDTRWSKMFKQEEYWNAIIGSCHTSDEAKEALSKLLKNERVPTRKERFSSNRSKTK